MLLLAFQLDLDIRLVALVRLLREFNLALAEQSIDHVAQSVLPLPVSYVLGCWVIIFFFLSKNSNDFIIGHCVLDLRRFYHNLGLF